MKYLLDTCSLSYFARGDRQVQKRLIDTSPAQLAVTTVPEMEIVFGLLLHPERARRLGPVMRALLDQLQVLPYEREDARATAAVRVSLQRAGTPLA